MNPVLVVFSSAVAVLTVVGLLWAFAPSAPSLPVERRPCEVVLAEEPMMASELGQILRCMRDDIKALKAK